jgi:hypothetical protein
VIKAGDEWLSVLGAVNAYSDSTEILEIVECQFGNPVDFCERMDF